MGAALTEGLGKSILVFRRDNGLNKGQRLMAKGMVNITFEISREDASYIFCATIASIHANEIKTPK